MEKLKVFQLQAGMILAEPIFGPNGKVLLNEGSKLDFEMIERLKKKGVFEVSVNEETTASIDPNEVLVNRVSVYAKQNLDKFYPLDIASKQLAQINQRHQTVSAVMKGIISNPTVHSFFLDLRTTDDFTLEHSVNVCVLSLIVGVTLEIPFAGLIHLGTGSLLHDIGMKGIDTDIINKHGELTAAETEKVNEHTKMGYQILRDNGFAPEIARIALYHHERWDGSGYPSKLAMDKIDFYSRIVAVADVYDALTGERAYRERYLPHQAIEFLYGAGNYYFDAKVVNAFTQSIAAYPLGSLVQLSTGEIGVVINIQKTSAPRPIVKICYDKDNKKLEFPRQVDLIEEKTIFINKIL